MTQAIPEDFAFPEVVLPGGRPLPTGFTLLEVLIVLLLLGILSATGASFYAGVTRNTHRQTISDTLSLFVSACRERAIQRGLPVRLQRVPNAVRVEGAPHLGVPAGFLTEDSRAFLAGVVFLATQTVDGSGKILHELPLRIVLPGESPAQIRLALGPG